MIEPTPIPGIVISEKFQNDPVFIYDFDAKTLEREKTDAFPLPNITIEKQRQPQLHEKGELKMFWQHYHSKNKKDN